MNTATEELGTLDDLERQAFGRRLRSAMVLQGLTTTGLAHRMHISQMSVQRHMRGDNMPDAAQLYRYCRILHVSSDYLLELPRLDSNQEPAGYPVRHAS